jgi:hypothetical protein
LVPFPHADKPNVAVASMHSVADLGLNMMDEFLRS